ncbi:MAG: TerB family tellurite resistance protein [Deltaproteobacteria bacterium]|nr:TerB family tellurite resistance protein [Deltaproteobacteria bacterium]
MLTTGIRSWLASSKESDESPQSAFSREDLAAAALMVECARVDRDHSEEEQGKIVAIIRERCSLDHETAECLVAVADRKNDEVWHDWLFTSTIKEAYDETERLKLIEHLWEIAAADGAIHDFEEKLVERIARELAVSDDAVSESRARVTDRMGLAEVHT